MHTLTAFLLTVAASVLARPPGPVPTTASKEDQANSPTRKYLKDYLLPRFIWPHYFSLDDAPIEELQIQREPLATEWLSQEIDRLSNMPLSYKADFSPRLLRADLPRWPEPLTPNQIQPYDAYQAWPAVDLVAHEINQQMNKKINKEIKETIAAEIKQQIKEEMPHLLDKEPQHGENLNIAVEKMLAEEAKKKNFAMTPEDDGYFEFIEEDDMEDNSTSLPDVAVGAHPTEGGRVLPPEQQPEPPRQIRQNPNLSRTKTLVAENLDNLRVGLGHEDMGAMDNSRHMTMLEGDSETFYGVALLSAIGAAAVLTIIGFAFGWYTLSKRAKAAADVDYPAYGVTGPTVDSSGDRKLAHSAHMYHYQHQKQQIIAMEKSGMEQRSGSVSDPESEDENEEGDYTVYECPGFATTGEMEVKNPLFTEEPTPATPGKCELVKPQPKN